MPRLTAFPNGVSSFGYPVLPGGLPGGGGPVFFASPYANGNGNGSSPSQAFTTAQRAIDAALGTYGASVFLLPGAYDEAVTIDRPSAGSAAMIIQGLGPPGSVGIAPTTVNASGLTNHADDVAFLNVGMAGNGTGTGLVNTGSRAKAFGCKFENDDGTGLGVQMTLGTVAQHAAGSRGTGGDCSLEGCEFAWAASGLLLTGTDYGAVTELKVRNGWFHDLDTKHIYESVGAGGSAAVTYASLELAGNIHQTDEAGTAPADYVLLNANNANSGLMTGCVFPQALAGGKVLVSTKLVVVGCFFTGGISTAQPS